MEKSKRWRQEMNVIMDLCLVIGFEVSLDVHPFIEPDGL
jgi:hypothetical protein